MAKGFLIAGLDFTNVADDEYHEIKRVSEPAAAGRR